MTLSIGSVNNIHVRNILDLILMIASNSENHAINYRIHHKGREHDDNTEPTMKAYILVDVFINNECKGVHKTCRPDHKQRDDSTFDGDNNSVS